jgi:hypothetical protein
MRFSLLVGLLLAAAAWVAACGDQPKTPEPSAPPGDSRGEGPPTALWDVVEDLRDEAARDRHPADGAGRAWIEPVDGAPPRAKVGESGRFPIVFEAGPLGIDEGGVVFLQVSPYWGWSTPHLADPQLPGFTEVTTQAQGVVLEPETIGPQLLAIGIAGRRLEAGEQVRIDYGSGPAGAVVDKFAERGSQFWLAVDGNADGIRAFLPDPPKVDVAPGPARILLLHLPSVARPGATVRLTAAVLDAAGSTGLPVEGEIVLEVPPKGVEMERRIALDQAMGGRIAVPLVAREPGVVRLRATGPNGLSAESNPMLVTEEAPRILWGDLHGHSNFSDGTGLPEDYYRYARDVAALDVAVLTDHDHWGIPFLDEATELWEEIQEQTHRFYEPGRFVTLEGYEWTNWIYGHRHVLHFGTGLTIRSSIDPAFDTPTELWDSLRGEPALTVAHHSAGGPIAVDWSFPPDPELEPITEIVSVHGSSESLDGPGAIYSPIPGNFVVDALAKGYRLGFVGSGDSHDGHPGLVHLASGGGGLAAILSEEATRESVLSALRARRAYATNGARIVLDVELDGRPMGSVVPAAAAGRLEVKVVTPDPLDRIDLVADGQVVDSIPGEEKRMIAFESQIRFSGPGTLYVRVVQTNGGAAWSSPFFLE